VAALFSGCPAAADGNGEVVGLTFVMNNITQLKKAESEMLTGWPNCVAAPVIPRCRISIDWRAFHKQVTATLLIFSGAKVHHFSVGLQDRPSRSATACLWVNWDGYKDLSLDVGAPAIRFPVE